MKKLWTIVLSIVVLVLIVGCRAPNETKINVRTLIPDPYDIFSGSNFTYSAMGNGDTSYGFIISDIVTYEMYEQYLNECRERGFTNIVLGGESMYWARTEDDLYYLELYWSESSEDIDENNYIMAFVQVHDGDTAY